MATTARLPVDPKSVMFNPTHAELKELARVMPNARMTEFGNVNVHTRVVARSKASTFIITDTPEKHSDQTITREEGRKIAEMQNRYVREQDMLVIDGFV